MVALACDAAFEPYIRRELLHWYASADESTKTLGRQWYRAAKRAMRKLARSSGYSLEQAVAVMAVTSPVAQLVSNVKWTNDALHSRGTARVGRFPNVMGAKVRAMLDSPRGAAEFVTGPKVDPFFRAILGDRDALVVDRWAFRAATGESDLSRLTPRIRRAVDTAYRSSASLAGEDVRDFQAIVWIQCRETTPNARGSVRKLGDIFDV